MNFSVIIPIILIMVALAFSKRVSMLFWLVIWWVAILIALKHGMTPPVPSSLIGMYMTIVSIALLVYVLSDVGRTKEVWHPVRKFLIDSKYNKPLGICVVLISLFAAFNTYKAHATKVAAPYLGRTIHPAPPENTTFKGKNIDLLKAHNPFRELQTKEPEKFKEHVANGRKVYYENCFYCHGDNMTGSGPFAHGLDPLPANFQDVGTIAQLQEAFLFWRIAKGGPGLPEESTPWASSMPAWENFLSEDEIWDVILFLYEFTGHKPRAEEGVHE